MRRSIPQFADHWRIAALTERQGAQQHFLELCDLLGEPHPGHNDPTGDRYTFEKPVARTSGGKGFADVWLRDHFGWEYKGPHKDLKAAYRQLNDYREDLLNPPLLVVSDFDRFEIHTNFPNTKKRVYAFNLSDLERNQITAACPLPPLEVLRALFGDYTVLRPDRTDARVTQEVALLFTRLAERLELEERNLHATKEEVAHFLMRLLFCLFADSVGLLPNHLFRSLLQSDERFVVKKFLRKLSALFAAMAERDGIFGEHSIKYFNGGLFDSGDIIALDAADIAILNKVAANYDWSHIAPAIFGTLFERSLDPARRSLIGAHYTSEEDILLLVEPVVMRPLEQRWAHTRDSIRTTLGLPTHTVIENELSGHTNAVIPTEALRSDAQRRDLPISPLSLPGAPSMTASSSWVGSTTPNPAPKPHSLLTSNPEAERLLAGWFDELHSIRILDPACGSGNFLYVALRRLLDLWKEARDFAIHHNIQLAITHAVEKMVSPTQFFGIETEFYAHELASIVVWIGFLQWKHDHGIAEDREPILQKLSNIEHADAILRYDAEGKPYEPTWPRADFIIGNPPFLGGKLLRRELGDKYIDDLFNLYKGRVKAESDLVVYWFEKARAQMEGEEVDRVGLLATQGIRGGANRNVLERIQTTGIIFWAWSDREWLLKGATVHVSMIAFERVPHDHLRAKPQSYRGVIHSTAASSQGEAEALYLLDGQPAPFINPDLTTGSNTTSALRLKENENLCFMGTTKVGPFDIDSETAHRMLAAPLNPNGRPNSDVVRPWVNALDITRRPRNMFIIDFGTNMSEAEAALYQAPFEYIKQHVKPVRAKPNRDLADSPWWIHGRPRGELRSAIKPLRRYILTSRVSKYRLFIWLSPETIPDSATFAIAREDDYFFGVLHSSIHELWARAQGTQLRELESGFRYTPNSTFDTFPFPWPPGTEPSEADSPIVHAIAEAARELVRLRDAWLNPPGAFEADLKSRTLTKLYNERPTWLSNAHRTLDTAVFAAYGWPAEQNGQPLTTQQILANLLALNHQRAAASSPPK